MCAKNSKNPKNIEPQYLKNERGKVINVYLPIDTYDSILKRIKELKKKKSDLKAKQSIKKAKNK